MTEVTLTVADWPFLPEEKRTPEQNERWWRECYVPPPADVTLRGVAHSVIVTGGPGSGKSVLIKAFERIEAERLLIVRYPLARWPDEPHAWITGYGHLGQIMACASMRLKELLARQPDRLVNTHNKKARLSKINLEYLRWLIEKYSGERAFRRWADALNYRPLLKLLSQPFKDIYPTDAELLDVQGQIEELVTLSRRLGFAGVAVLVDINPAEINDELRLEKVRELFGWLTPLQFEGFAIKAALPDRVVEQAQLLERSRGRITFTASVWPVELCREVSSRHLRAATAGQLTELAEIVAEELLSALEKEFPLLYGRPTPKMWLQLTQVLLDKYVVHPKKLTRKNCEEIIHLYFSRHVRLKLDRIRRGVWRGDQFIGLDEQPFRFLEVLWQYRGGGDATKALLKVARTQGNLNTIANRVRKKVEPAPDNPVYVHNSRSLGYWLENVDES